KIHSLTHPVRPTGPTGIHEPDIHVGIVDFAGEHCRVARRMEWHERCTETSRESIDGFIDTRLRSRYLRGVSTDKMKGCLCRRQLREGRKNTTGVTGEEEDVSRIVSE